MRRIRQEGGLMNIRGTVIIVLAAMVASCAVYKVPDVDLTQERYPGLKLSDKYIYVNKPYDDIEHVPFVVLRAWSNDSPKYAVFVEESLKKMGFQHVLSESDFALRLIAADPEGSLRENYDLVSLHRAYEKIGRFLVIKASLEHLGSYWFSTEIEVVDPKSTQVLFKVYKHGANMLNLDTEFNYPAINALNEWYKASK